MGMPRKAVVSGALTAGLMLITAVTASANQAGVRAGGQDRGYGGVNNHGRHVYACDTKGDNWGVRTHYVYLVSGSSAEHSDTVGDGNGSSSGCGIRDLPTDLHAIRFNVCAGVSGADTGCTGWITVNQND
jgi:hypothetical protein